MAAMNGADPDSVREHVARITASELFAGAERLCRFLRFTVESTLNGHEANVKEYTLGREVFDRGEDYDPRLDPIVRVEARRLRSRLAEYYGGPGRDEPLRLEYRKGSYVPVVSITNESAPSPVAPQRIPDWIVGIVIAAAALAIAATTIPRLITAPMTAPIPASWVELNDGTLDGVDVALAADVDAGLANRPGSHVVAWPVIAQKPSYRGVLLRDVAAQLHAPRLVLITVRDDGPARYIRVFVIQEPEGSKRLALTYYADSSLSKFAVQSRYADRIVRDLTQR
jgi:hypothetical protein